MAGEMVDAGAEDLKRKKILDGVRVFVLREGVSSVTMEQIAVRQGISKKTLYKYFANKDQLIAEAIEERIADIARQITSVVEDRGRPFPERMSRILGIVGGQLALIGDRLLNDLVYREPKLWERIDRFRREHVFVAISKLFEEGIRAGFVRTDIETRLGADPVRGSGVSDHEPTPAFRADNAAGGAFPDHHPNPAGGSPHGGRPLPASRHGGNSMKVLHAVVLGAGVLALAACGAKSADIEASGTIEATSVRVSSRVGGEIVRMAASEGESVARGALLAEIDHAALDLQLGQARSGVDLARAELDLLTSGARKEDVSQAQEALIQAGQSLRSAQTDFDRTTRLFAAGAATPKERDDAEARLTGAKAQAAAAEQALKKLQNFARPEDLKAGFARVSQAEYTVRLLQMNIKDCTVTSPIDGTVTEKLSEAGELATSGTGLYVVSDLSTVKLTIYVPEAELGSLRLGQQARVRIDSFPGRDFAGTITWISPVAEFTPRDIQTKDERVKLVFAVRIEMANPDGVFKPGMPADAVVREAGGR